MKKSYQKVICKLLLVIMLQVLIFAQGLIAYADTYTCGNSPLNDGKVYDCNNSPLNAGGTPGHYEGGTTCAPYSGTICNICNGNYARCSHYSGTYYNGVKCTPYYGSICNICYDNYARCSHYSGVKYNQTWVPETPNTYHTHTSSCTYHYTTHTHTSSCPTSGTSRSESEYAFVFWVAGADTILAPVPVTGYASIQEEYNSTSSGSTRNYSLWRHGVYGSVKSVVLGGSILVKVDSTVNYSNGSSTSISYHTSLTSDIYYDYKQGTSTVSVPSGTTASCQVSWFYYNGAGNLQTPIQNRTISTTM